MKQEHAAIYVRVSTEKQRETSTSPDKQREECFAYARTMGWIVDERHVFEDLAVSGSKSSRPALDSLVALAMQGHVRHIVVHALDRIFRDQRGFQNLIHDLQQVGVQVHYVTNDFPDTPEGNLMRTMVSGFAEYERKKIRAAMEDGQRRIAEAGFWPAGVPPFGYGLELVPPNRKRVVVLEAEAEVVRTAVSLLVDEGMSTAQAAERLNALGLFTRGARRRGTPPRPAPWTYKTLHKYLIDATWLSGEYLWRKTSLYNAEPVVLPDFPAILTPERHQALRAELARRATGPRPRETNRFYPLSGRIFGTCGVAFSGQFVNGRGYRLYRCRNCETAPKCGEKRQKADYLEGIAWGAVCDLLSQPDRLLVLAQEQLGRESDRVMGGRQITMADLDKKISAKEKALTAMYAASFEDGLDPVAMRAATSMLKEELDSLRRHRESLVQWEAARRGEEDRIQRLHDLATFAKGRLGSFTPQEQAVFYDLLDLRVEILTPGARLEHPIVRIEGAVPPALLESSNDWVQSDPRFFRTEPPTAPTVPLPFAMVISAA